jgi:HEPN domain-containing protein
MNRKDFQALARVRLKEARALLAAECYDGAYYLAGYVVECALKAVIAKQTTRHEFPERKKAQESHTHNFPTLIRVAELEDQLDEEERSNPAFRNLWKVVLGWSETSRYSTATSERAKEIIRAVNDSSHGVLKWLRRFW